MGFFKSKREKLLKVYKKLFNIVQVYGGIYGYLLRSGDTASADRFKRAYDEWRQVSPLLVGATSRKEASQMLDEYFNAAVVYKDIIKKNPD